MAYERRYSCRMSAPSVPGRMGAMLVRNIGVLVLILCWGLEKFQGFGIKTFDSIQGRDLQFSEFLKL